MTTNGNRHLTDDRVHRRRRAVVLLVALAGTFAAIAPGPAGAIVNGLVVWPRVNR